MSEDEARHWLSESLDVSRETLDRIARFIELLKAAATEQNLIASSTWPTIWQRHIVDSAQLLLHAPQAARSWIDMGTGAGFPGLIIALLADLRVELIDSRRRRVEFLLSVIDRLELGDRVAARCARVETVDPRPYDVISARAFAPLDRLFALGQRFSRPDTIWLLPKGRSAASELEAARGSWQGEFRVVPSVTDPEAAIIVARGVQAKGKS